MTAVTVRKFGYFHENPDRTVDFSISPIVVEGDVEAEFQRLTQPLFEFFPIAIAIEVCERDLSALQSVPNRMAQLWLDSSLSSSHDLNVIELLVEAVARVNALLASASAYLGQSQKSLAAAKYVTEADAAAWNALRNAVHKTSSAYRIMYQMRNFAQHYALPISRTEMKLDNFSDSDRVATGFFIWLDRAKLLSSGFDWGKTRADLETQHAEFDASLLLAEYVCSLRELFLDVAQRYEPYREELRRYFVTLRRSIGAPAGSRLTIVRRAESDAGLPPEDAEILPEAQLRWTDALVERIAIGARSLPAT